MFYLSTCLNGLILTKWNLVSMDLGEPGAQDFGTAG